MADNAGVSRRGFLQAAAGGSAVAAATGTAAGQENESSGNTTSGNETSGNATSGGGGGGGGAEAQGPPDLGGYLDDVSNYSGSVTDNRGQSEVTVQVGVENGGNPFGFGPAAVWVDNGATVLFEWTGEGGGHNVVSEDEVFNSGSTVGSAGVNFEYTFAEDGVYPYYCNPHKGSGMKGVIVVGSDIPRKAPPGESSGPAGLPDSVKSIGIATSLVMTTTLGLAYFFMKYGGDYEVDE